MHWYLDTEFRDNGRVIELISIGLVAADGREYYAVSNEFDAEACCDWVKANVLSKLPPLSERKPRAQIRDEITALIGPTSSPVFWGWFSAYDWVVFCQLFGRMLDLPPKWPNYCNDLVAAINQHGIPKAALPQQSKETLHNALDDARWVRDSVQMILK